MKKILTFAIAILLFCGWSLQAAPVSKSRALDVAKRVFASQPATKASGDVKLIWDGEDVATKASVQPAFYVFNRDGGGFVIIAGDDNVQPVLAISDRNDFQVEGMPANVKWWMDRMKAWVRATTAPMPGAAEQWMQFVGTKSGPLPDGTYTVTEEHLTPEWNQGDANEYYNGKCPMDTEAKKRCITGCVATALGEILTTMGGIYPTQMPTAATGTVEPYAASTGFYSAAPEGHPYVLGTTYLWSELRGLTNYAKIQEASAEVRENLAQLLADLGAVMNASYSASSTGAITALAPDRMAQYYGCNKAAHFEEAAGYSARQWREKLKAELHKHPVLYNGRTEDDKHGHAFVFDGYGVCSGADVFHVNFGWGGSCNGYYYETNLDSDGRPVYNYSWNCGAAFDLYPDPTSTYPVVLSAYYNSASFPGVRAVLDADDDIVIYYFIMNDGKTAYNGNVKFAVEKKDGTVVPIDNSTRTVSLASYKGSGESFGYRHLNNIQFGDKVICLYEDGTDNWVKLEPGNPEQDIAEWPLVPATFIKTEASYSQNDWFAFALMNHSTPYAGSLWTVIGPDGNPVVESAPQSQKEVQLTQTGTYKIKVDVRADTSSDIIETVVTYITVN